MELPGKEADTGPVRNPDSVLQEEIMSIGDYIVATLMLATFGVLIAGIALMGLGGATNRHYGNKLMVARVSLQGMVVLMLALLFFLGKS